MSIPRVREIGQDGRQAWVRWQAARCSSECEADFHRCANGSSDAVGTTVGTGDTASVETQTGRHLERLSRTLEGNKAHGRRA